jgi:hypothetical protein
LRGFSGEQPPDRPWERDRHSDAGTPPGLSLAAAEEGNMGFAIDLRQTEWAPAPDLVLADLVAFFAEGEGLMGYPEIEPSVPANDNWPLAPPASQASEWPRTVWREEFRTAD